MQPFDYSGAFADVQSPLNAFTQALQTGAGIRQIGLQQQAQEAALAQQQAEQQRQAEMQADLTSLASDPTPQNIVRYSLKYPQLSENFKRTYDMLAPTERQSRLDAAIPAYMAVQNGRPDVAANLLRERATALENSDKADEAAQTRIMADMVEKDPKQAQALMGTVLAAALGPEKFTETFGKLGEEERAIQLQPGKLREQEAKAEEAGAKAKTAGVEAKYAEQGKQAEIKQAAANLGLTGAQTQQALAGAKNLSAQASKAALELEAFKKSGGVPPEKRFEYESKLRKEYTDQTKGFSEVKEAYHRLKSSEKTGVGDISLIFAYMKMLDPASVVREGEQATAQNSGGIPATVVNAYNRALNGQRLTEKQRNDFISQGQKLMNAAGVREKEVRKGIDTIATNYGLDKRNLYYNDADMDGARPLPPKPAAPAIPKGWGVKEIR